MRILHVRTIDERQRTAYPQLPPLCRRCARGDDRQSLPVLKLQSLRGSGAGCRKGRRAMTPLKTVGHATPRIDAIERVTGKAAYTNDVRLPGMLYARILRSPHPHARIRRIDLSKAMALSGVKTILTHENCEVVWGAGGISGGQQYNDDIKKITKHRRYVFNNPVRFVGDPVAAVAAVNRHVAEEAVRLIQVDYDVLSFVLEPEEALK